MSSISSSPRNKDHESESTSSNDPNPKSMIYDVFLTNFCVKEDTCKSFASHLYSALTEAGVHAFWDNGKLRSDEDQITPSVLHAVRGSRMSIIVFSRNYGDESRWCLQVLEKIMECRRTIDQMVVLVFYEVDPSDVYKQICGEEAFNFKERILLGEEDELTSWKAELLEDSNISEFVLTDSR
ncbi:Toll/interleukin-1 receptor-like proteiny [Sesbania bispinosa]|nr:Toll/interleukin-1 receptor-like proteiny [Sesbania bispinosa]